MKFNLAWAKVISENSLLRMIAGVMTLATLSESFALLIESQKPPLVIDRACTAAVATLATSNERSGVEIQAFLEKALHERFDTEAPVQSILLVDTEVARRQKEQADLKLKGITQRILPDFKALRVVEKDKDTSGKLVEVTTDRLLSVGVVRSAFLFPIQVTIATVTRTEANPWGLVISAVKSVDAAGQSPQVSARAGGGS